MADSSLSKRDKRLWVALLIAACAVTYANGIFGAFTYDDKAVVRDNPRIRSPRNVRQIFTTSYFGGPRGTGSAYRPLLFSLRFSRFTSRRSRVWWAEARRRRRSSSYSTCVWRSRFGGRKAKGERRTAKCDSCRLLTTDYRLSCSL